MSIEDWVKISENVYNSRYVKPTRRRDGRANSYRKEAHDWFDKIWRQGIMTRSEAYEWLSVQLGVPKGDCHMGMMSRADCEKVIAASKALLSEGKKRGDLSVQKAEIKQTTSPHLRKALLVFSGSRSLQRPAPEAADPAARKE